MDNTHTQLEDVGRLGFGMMRLPKKGIHIDLEQTSEMVDMFLGAGFTYFDWHGTPERP